MEAADHPNEVTDYHSQPQSHRMKSANLSFLRSALHNGHSLIHMNTLQTFYTWIT